jgi:hypothetical protein
MFTVCVSLGARELCNTPLTPTLFAFQSDSEPREASTDETALFLPGEKADEFRDFLWAMYAL